MGDDNTRRRVQIITSDGLLYNRGTVEALMSEFPYTGNSSVNVVSIIGPPTGNHNLFKYLSGADLENLETSRNRFLIFLRYIVYFLGTLLRFLGNCLTGNMHRNSNHTSNRETTHGVYLSKSSKNPFMLIMDVQGSNSTTGKAQDGPSFEDRAALLTLSISDALLLSLPSSAIGNLREDVPLLTIFKERLKLQKGSIKIVVALHHSNPADTNDTSITDTKTIKDYENDVIKKMEKIWGNLHSSGGPDIKFEDYFEVFVIVLPSHRESEALHDKLEDLELHTGTDIYLAEKFPNTVETNWSTIVENNDVQLLPIKVTKKMIAETSVEDQSNNELQASQIEQGSPSSIDNNNIAEPSRREGFTLKPMDMVKKGVKEIVNFSEKTQKNVTQMITGGHDKVIQMITGDHDKVIQMITGDEEKFQKSAVEKFMAQFQQHNKVNVISIIGPQTTGKSSLLNKVFQTDFSVLGVDKNWGQETSGIWISKSNTHPSMVIMDVEGSDAEKRAVSEQGTSFENKSALLALITSDVMLLNLPSRAIGQHQGGCVPLLETIFKERLKFPQGKVKIVVILRDCTNVENKGTKKILKDKMEKIWTSVNSAPKDCKFENYIEVHVRLFPHYKERKELFISKCDGLRKWLSEITSEAGTLGASNFSTTVENIWTEIKDNKDLNVPSIKMLLSERNCQGIMDEILAPLKRNEKPAKFQELESSTSPEEFNRMLNGFINSTLKCYDEATSGNVKEAQERIKNKLQIDLLHLATEKFRASIRRTIEVLVQEFKKKIPEELEMKRESFLWSITMCKRQVLANVDNDECIEPYLHKLEQSCKGHPEMYKEVIGEEKSRFKVDLMKPLEKAKEEIQERHKKKLQKWRLLLDASKPALMLARAVAKPFVRDIKEY